MGLGLTGLMVVEVLSWCCIATPNATLRSWDASFLGAQVPWRLPESACAPGSKAQRYRGAGARLGILELLSAIPRSSNSGSLNRFQSEPAIQVGESVGVTERSHASRSKFDAHIIPPPEAFEYASLFRALSAADYLTRPVTCFGRCAF